MEALCKPQNFSPTRTIKMWRKCCIGAGLLTKDVAERLRIAEEMNTLNLFL
jgi:hypothetical protein